uniref:Uncharacterized protein n=1 Tax=Leersia perrieri TaxID=77586 RepID=A0A0D9WMC5_9ORYZ
MDKVEVAKNYEEACRVSDRLDGLMAEMASLKAAVGELEREIMEDDDDLTVTGEQFTDRMLELTRGLAALVGPMIELGPAITRVKLAADLLAATPDPHAPPSPEN